MRAVGLIVEYNPFHNGHLHHLQESRRISGAEVAVAVMSGHFLQRGEPALVDKWTRTEMALAAGVDLVVELPLPFACNSAPHFADGAVRLLDALGVESLCFGSEAGELAPLQRCAVLLAEESAQIRRRTAQQLRHGIDYASARAALAKELLGDAAAALATPNNILGIEYLRALIQSGSRIRPLTVARLGAGYHDAQPVGAIASATALRGLHAAGAEIGPYLPPATHLPWQAALADERTLDPQLWFRILAARLLRGPESLTGGYQLSPGLEQRIYRAAASSDSWEGLLAALATRQLTRSRLRRLLCHLLFDLGAEAMTRFLAAGPLYLRLLGGSERGERYLAATRKARPLPVLANLSRAESVLRRHYGAEPARLAEARALLEADLLATRLYGLLLRRSPPGGRNRDYCEEVRRSSGKSAGCAAMELAAGREGEV